MRIRQLLLIFLTTAAGAQSVPAPSRAEPPLHGTINIALANENGMVLVTDSALSSSGHFIRNDQKLFKIDDGSYVAIAGQYSARGPSIQGSYPAAFLLPSIIQRYLAGAPRGPQWSIENRAMDIGSVVAFGLTFLSHVSIDIGQPLQAEGTFITVVGYEHGVAKISQVRVAPDPRNDYSIARTCTYSGDQYNGGHAGGCLAGLWTEASVALSHPAADGTAELKAFTAAQEKGEGATFPLAMLAKVAEQAAKVAVEAHPGEVGLPLQEVVLSDGVTMNFKQPLARDHTHDEFQAIGFNIVERAVFDNSGNPRRAGGISAPRGNHAALVADTTVTNCLQPLDHILFFQSTFNDCVFTYKEPTLAWFDKRNTLANSHLVLLGPNVPKGNPFIVQLLADFPQLRTVSAKDAPYLLWPTNLP